MPRKTADVTAVVISPFKGADGKYRTKEGELYVCALEDFERLQRAGCLAEPTEEDLALQEAKEEPKKSTKKNRKKKISTAPIRRREEDGAIGVNLEEEELEEKPKEE